MESLISAVNDYSGDTFRNIVSLRESQDLFGDLSENTAMSDTAVAMEMHVKRDLAPGLIDRGFAYTTAIAYPFETASYLDTRYGDGSYPVWYGSLDLDTTIFETVYHFKRELSALQGIAAPITRERAVYLVRCEGILVDLVGKEAEHPFLVGDDYTSTQAIGKRLSRGGFPGLLAPSARRRNGVNIAAFRRDVLSDPRNYCYLSYTYEPGMNTVEVERQAGEVVFSL